MHILFDLRWMADTVTVKRGIGRIALATLQELAKGDGVVISFLGLPNFTTPELEAVVASVDYQEFYVQPDLDHNAPLTYATRFNHWLDTIAGVDGLDLFFDPAPTIVTELKPHYINMPYVVVFYDIIPTLFGYSEYGDRWQGVQHLIANADGIIAISNSAFASFLERFHGDIPCRNDIVALPPLGLPIADDFDRPRKPYILSITSPAPHKDGTSVIQALARCSDSIKEHYSIKMLGINDPMARMEYERLAVLHGVQLELLDTVSDDELVTLYREASLVFHGSLYEGLGLPPIEAALLGTPSLCATGGALAELPNHGYGVFESGNYLEATLKIEQYDNLYAQLGATETIGAYGLIRMLELNQRAMLSLFADDYYARIKPVLEAATNG